MLIRNQCPLGPLIAMGLLQHSVSETSKRLRKPRIAPAASVGNKGTLLVMTGVASEQGRDESTLGQVVKVAQVNA